MHHITVTSPGSLSFNPLLVVYLAIALVALGVMRHRERPWQRVWKALGWRGSDPIWFAWAVLIAVAAGGATTIAFVLLVPGYVRHPAAGTDQYAYARLGLSLASVARVFGFEAVNQTLGEEVFFRGLLGGWLMTRLGFQVGNALQAFLFLVPHLTLLIVSTRLWPILLFQLAGGWLLGWLRFRSGSILPGWLSHTIVNTAADVLFILG